MKKSLKRVTVSGLVLMLICNQLIPASAASGQMTEKIVSQERNDEAEGEERVEISIATPSNGEKSEIPKRAKATSSNAYLYQFEDNMIANSDFNEGKNNWAIQRGGISGSGNTNPQGSGGNYFYLDGGGTISQSVQVPFTGYYHISAWLSTGAGGNRLSVKRDGNLTGKLEIEAKSTYTLYELEVFLEKDDIAEVSVSAGNGWVNGDDISLSYVTTKFPNMAVNGDFKKQTGWTLDGASIADGKAILEDEFSSISQTLFIPQDGPYFAEIKAKEAENLTVSFGGEEGIFTEEGTYRVAVPELSKMEEEELLIVGKGEVLSAEVRFDVSQIVNNPPVAANVGITGELISENAVIASYDFSDEDGHEEGISHYAWLLSETEEGEYEAISGETAKTIMLREEYGDRYLKFQVTPVDQYELEGVPAISKAFGPVDVNLVKNPGFEQDRVFWNDVKIENHDAHTGLVRGIISSGKTSYQNIRVSKSGIYELSAYTRYKGNLVGKMWISDDDGMNYGEAAEVVPTKDYSLVKQNGIILEKGQEIRLILEGAEDAPYDVDDIKMIADRTQEVPVFKNILSFYPVNRFMEHEISRKNKTITLRYLYGEDVSAVEIKELLVSEGATASVQAGDILDLTEPKTILVTGSDGEKETWTITAQSEEKQVHLESSNTYLEDTFNWAAKKQKQFVMTGKTGLINKDEGNPNGSGTSEYIPSYWAGYYDRTAFYSRDFVHQATGGQIAGLAEENYSMFHTFAQLSTEARKWYTVWAVNFDGTPHTIDYKNDNNFVREVPAQFELVEKAYKQYLWSGDDRYIDDEMFEFYTKVMTDYVSLHDNKIKNGVAEGTGEGIFSGSCTYNERGGEKPIEAGDSIGSQYQATLAYAGILSARGDEAGAQEWYKKAEDLKEYFNKNWSQNPAGELANYARVIEANGRKFYDFGKENSWFMPLKMITEPGERNDRYIQFILENLGNGIGTHPNAPNNLEAYTYIPDMLFLYNQNDEAWKWMKYITSIKDTPHERPSQGTNGDYPEISFTFVSHTIEGMMGVEPDARVNFIATAPRLPEEVEDVTARYITIGDMDIDLTHEGNQYTTIRNRSEKELTWEARFYGTFAQILMGDEVLEAQQKDINGETVSYVTVTVGAGEELSAGIHMETASMTANPANDSLIKVDDRIQVNFGQKMSGIPQVKLEGGKGAADAMLAADGRSMEITLAMLEHAANYQLVLEGLKDGNGNELEHNLLNYKTVKAPEKAGTAQIKLPVDGIWVNGEKIPGQNVILQYTSEITTSDEDIFKKSMEIPEGYKLNSFFELDLLVNETVAEHVIFGQKTQVKIPFQGEANRNYQVAHLRGNGRIEHLDAMLQGSTLVFYVDSFSPFAILEQENAEKPGGNTPDHSSSGGGSSSGAKSNGEWKQDLVGWWYCYPDKTFPNNGWAYLSFNGTENWYYFDEKGYMLDGWVTHDGSVYYLSTTSDGTRGQMYTGWRLIDGRWYYFNPQSGGPMGALLVNDIAPGGYVVGGDGGWIQ